MPRKMSDGIVDPRTVLDLVLQLQNHGTLAAMQQLEATEPELANYLFETLSSIHQQISSVCASSARTRRLYRQIELMALVCIQALRHSHAQLWQQQIDHPPSHGPADSTPS